MASDSGNHERKTLEGGREKERRQSKIFINIPKHHTIKINSN